MIARSFKSVAWVAAIGAAALICYMFSLRGAAERADLVQLNVEAVRLQQSIRTLQTELGTRGRIDQLQHWASADFGFAAPVANQFIDGEVTLARLDQPPEPAPLDAPVRMAQAPSARPAPQVQPAPVPAPAMPRVIHAAAPQRSARSATPAQPILRRAAMVEPPARTSAPSARPAAKPAERAARRPSALVSARTLRDLSTRERAERSRGGAH